MNTNASKSVRSKIARKVLDLPRSGIRDFFEIVSTRKDIISLGIGEPDFNTPWHIREASIFAIERGATCYTSNLGLLKLRRGLADYAQKTFNLHYLADKEILVTVGVSEALDIAMRALLEPGDEVLYHEPCFVSYAPEITLAGGVAVPVTTRMEDQFRLTRSALEAKVTPKTKLLLLNFPNNPTGAVLDEAAARDIAAFAIEHDLIVISDEIYAELTYDSAHFSIASVPGMKERTVFMHGFSKTWAMTGLRLGYVCAPPELIEAMMKIHQYLVMCASTPSQEAGVEALLNGALDVHKMRESYKTRRNFIHTSFEEMGVPCIRPLGAFYAFPGIAQFGLTSHEFATRLLDEESVAAVPGTAFGLSGEGFLRCSYATSMEQIEEAMSRFERFIKRLK
ncbi:MAG: aminotransferase class I/II-fold pyridoxal phosphate-dependent enzyme [Kiritimatiellae bacterium]|nr:aminotransferase class I/II-fold pyridoxal phosphate-dependent enzyme [Kiritimatiellia bacterium]MDD4735752.1 aminotransferase class I/II-fold pyridoxal phosphate-dependent enzyme [Kiritimatiellia bacterium]